MKTDIWHIGYIRQPIANMIEPGALQAANITWLPASGSFRFIADPFGVKTESGVTLFVEYFDYRIKRGEIHYYSYDVDNVLSATGLALSTPFHLSYPFLVREGGRLYMLPEAHKSGVLTLYHCDRFPDLWSPVATLLDVPAIDATVVQHDGKWWMFYALPGPNGRAMRELHIAYADQLAGPWREHVGNPVCAGFDSSRPGGTAFKASGHLHLPVQDCVGGYGVGLNILRLDELTTSTFRATLVNRLEAGQLLPGYGDGLHTLAGDEDFTFIDVKRVSKSPMAHWVKLQHKLMRLIR